MYTYMTPSDSGSGGEGIDEEENGLSDLFDDPSDDAVTFDMEPDRPFAFDGTGQLIAEEQLEGTGQLTARGARRLARPSLVEQSGLGGLGETATTLDPEPKFLPPAPAGQKWKLIGPSKVGEGYDWETVAAEIPKPGPVAGGFMELVKRNKAVSGGITVVTLGALWWLFLRKRG